MTLAPENLLVKEIGQKVKAKEMFQHFKSYLEFYKGAELPGPKIILPDAAEADNLSEVRAAKETYSALMEEVCRGDKPCLSTAHLEAVHQRIIVRALQQFNNKCKTGSQLFFEPYKVKLENKLEVLYGQFKMHNKSKNFKAARTPAVFCATAGICYILSRIFGCVEICSLPIFFNLMMVNTLLSLGIWAYAWNSRQMREITIYLDGAANLLWDIAMNLHLLWDNVIRPKYQYVLEMSLNRMCCMLQIQPESSNPCLRLGPKDHLHQYQVQQDGTKDEKANLLRDIVINLHLLWDVVKPTCQYFLERSLNILRWMLQNLPKSSNPHVGSAPKDDVHQDEVGNWTTDEEKDLQWIMLNMPQISIPAYYRMKLKEQLAYKVKLAKASSPLGTRQQGGTTDHLRKLPTRTTSGSRWK
ncbi:hypothetical protein B7P43_G00327 [Cryptotermes secundus]|uniref:Uncharacterized protein n=1 Tax=Cryptotermes secundus TaxID=105785 RepID=A0A2J7QVG9_9NEOP|nr:hypothetical protein B7P43_G00327 [Cryptotermes secundus]